MFANAAYLEQKDDDIVDLKKSLLVTAVGHYRYDERPSVWDAIRPDGRGDYQLLYIAGGRVQFFFEKKEKYIQKGNILLFRPGQEQIYYLRTADLPETYWVHFTGKDVESILTRYGILPEEQILATGLSQNFARIFLQMIQELRLRRSNYEEMLRLELRELILHVARNRSSEAKPESSIIDEIENSIHYFSEHYNRQIVIEKYAEDRKISSHWFIQNFKKVTKQTPMQYIINLRITAATRLMRDSSLNISQIANDVGYDNPLYFSRVFKNRMGMSPSAYRKKLLEETKKNG